MVTMRARYGAITRPAEHAGRTTRQQQQPWRASALSSWCSPCGWAIDRVCPMCRPRSLTTAEQEREGQWQHRDSCRDRRQATRIPGLFRFTHAG